MEIRLDRGHTEGCASFCQHAEENISEICEEIESNKEYKPPAKTIVHVDAFLKMLGAVTQDDKYEKILNEMIQKEGMKKGGISMLDVLTTWEEKGIEKGIEKGRIEGTVKTYKRLGLSKGAAIQDIMKEFSLSAKAAAEQVSLYWK